MRRQASVDWERLGSQTLNGLIDVNGRQRFFGSIEPITNVRKQRQQGGTLGRREGDRFFGHSELSPGI
jgi:hypothetical protein